MPNTHPPQDNDIAIHYVVQRAAEAHLARVLPVGCITKGSEGKELAEMGTMKEAGAVAFSDDGVGVSSTSVMQRALQYAGMLGVPIMQHCQDHDLMTGAMNSGAVAVRLDWAASPPPASRSCCGATWSWSSGWARGITSCTSRPPAAWN